MKKQIVAVLAAGLAASGAFAQNAPSSLPGPAAPQQTIQQDRAPTARTHVERKHHRRQHAHHHARTIDSATYQKP